MNHPIVHQDGCFWKRVHICPRRRKDKLMGYPAIICSLCNPDEDGKLNNDIKISGLFYRLTRSKQVGRGI